MEKLAIYKQQIIQYTVFYASTTKVFRINFIIINYVMLNNVDENNNNI